MPHAYTLRGMMLGGDFRFLTENSICKLSRTLVRFNAIPAIWTYAPLQFWITQNLLDPKIHPRNYSDIKLYGRLPAFFFYLVGIVGFYFLLRKTIPGINNSALLSLVLTLVLGISFHSHLQQNILIKRYQLLTL